MGFTVCGLFAGLIATLVTSADNFVLWSTMPTHRYFHPVTSALVNTLGSSTLTVLVLLAGPLLEWIGWGLLIDTVRAAVRAHARR